MSGALVAFVGGKTDREALRQCGVMPPEWFPDALGMGTETGERVWLWPHDPDVAAAERPGVPPHPGELLGLPCETESQRRLTERRLAKLFGAWVVHVLFLEQGTGTEMGRTGLGVVIRRARWVRRLRESVRYWFSDEQARNIRHLAVAVAQGGAVDATQEDIDSLNREIGRKEAFTALYFAGHQIETENENDVLSTKALWPTMTGRLLLRFLVALKGDNPELDGIFAGGIHLWKAGELLFEYPEEALSDKLKTDLPRLYRAIDRSGHAASGEGGANGTMWAMAPVFPGLQRSLRAFGPPIGGSIDGDWHKAEVERLAAERLDDGRWAELRVAARNHFVRLEGEAHAEGWGSGGMADFAPEPVFKAVADNPRVIGGELEKVSAMAEAPEVASEESAYKSWLSVVTAEKKRRAAQAKLSGAGAELAKAQRHYVTALYGAAAAVSVSSASGCALFWLLWAMGGDGAWPLAAGCAALAAVGAFVAWGTMSKVHCRAGCAAYKRFAKLAEAVDRAMDERHGAAAETTITAETAHRRLLREVARVALERLLNRIYRIVRKELESPPLSATVRDNPETDAPSGDGGGQVVLTDDEAELRNQRETYLGLSRWTADAGQLAGASVEAEKRVETLLAEVEAATGDHSFPAFWKQACDKYDWARQGNFPAVAVIPELRRWVAELVGGLLDARQCDFRAAVARAGDPYAGLLPDAGAVAVHTQDPFTWASAHVDNPHKREMSEHLFIFHKTPSGQPIPLHPRRIGNATCVMVSGMSGLPQAALYFVDIQVHGFKTGEHGKLELLDRPIQSEVSA